jgi:hypothetical protein
MICNDHSTTKQNSCVLSVTFLFVTNIVPTVLLWGNSTNSYIPYQSLLNKGLS